ncbi:MAG TPA: hypothetical protein PKC72_11150 [Chitinophagaceae bacterium]|nr:hypothetical protein [Chitinophagaceae bacterium]
MQSEKFDKKIREAAENHHPPYDDMAWSKMEKLLDEHLPQKEDKRRRFFFLIFLFLLLGSSTWLLVGKPWKSNSKIVKQEQRADNNNLHTRQVISPERTNEDIDNNVNKNLFPGDKNENKTENADVIPVTGSKGKENKTTTPSANKETGKEKKNVPDDYTIVKKNDRKQNNILVVPTEKSKNNVDKPGNSIVTIKKDKEKPSKNNEEKDIKNDPAEQKNTEPALAKSNKDKADEKEVDDPAKELTDEKKDVEAEDKENKQEKTSQPEEEQDNPVVNKPSNKKKQSSKKSNSLFFTLSTGPDFSFVGSEGPGKVKFVGGVGVGYTIKEKFTIRTGFYTARKLYTAQPSDYKAPPDFYTYYPYLEKIDADCKVYEIPLLISYSFGRSAKQNWFASTGLSSYLMKRETYDYFYKYTPTSPTISAEWTVPDRNNHFFSVLNLSAGYQRKIGKNFSLTIEPYMKIPLSGVGFGKVKLNSGGVLFSIGVHPFRQRK